MIDIDKLEAMIRMRKEPQALAAIAWVCPHCQGNESSCECDQELLDALPELLAEVRRLRRIKKTSDASASTLHAGIMSLINRHHGPPSIWDFTSWIDGELIRLRESLAEVRRLRRIEQAAKDALIDFFSDGERLLLRADMARVQGGYPRYTRLWADEVKALFDAVHSQTK